MGPGFVRTDWLVSRIILPTFFGYFFDKTDLLHQFGVIPTEKSYLTRPSRAFLTGPPGSICLGRPGAAHLAEFFLLVFSFPFCQVAVSHPHFSVICFFFLFFLNYMVWIYWTGSPLLTPRLPVVFHSRHCLALAQVLEVASTRSFCFLHTFVTISITRHLGNNGTFKR